MNAFVTFFSSPAIQPLGWTLFHSLWQGALITLGALVLLRVFISKSAQVKYAITLSGLALQFVISITTFIYVYRPMVVNPNVADQPTFHPVMDAEVQVSSLNTIQTWINSFQNYLPLFVLVWLAGAFIFSLRVIASGIYVTQLRKQVTTVLNDEVCDLLDCWLLKFGIRRKVLLVESLCIDTPMVIGYIKPLIVFPAGMICGLPTEQLELIVLHELTHIRRHDYIINILQLLMEAVFFFNPFVWMLSARARVEREHCCDDAVVQHTGKASLYAVTLAQLEEARLQRSPVALALGGTEYQLLKRIKRLMDKRVRPYAGRERIIPTVLMVIGIVCASWLTISTTREHDIKGGDEVINQDTTKNKKIKRAQFSKKKVTTALPEGTPRKGVKENFEGDVKLREAFTEPNEEFDFNFDFDFPEEGLVPPMPEFFFHYDTVPPIQWSWHDDDKVEKFGEEFQKKFQSQFGDFYQQHQEEIQKMMAEIQSELQRGVGDEKWQKDLEARMKEHQADIEHHLENLDLNERALAHQAEAMKKVEEHMRRVEEVQRHHAHEMEARAEAMEQHAKEMEKHARQMEEKTHQFEKEVKEQLVKDGYLKSGEKIENLNWGEDGKITINGKEIKESDRKKYNEIHRKYFNSKGNFIFVE